MKFRDEYQTLSIRNRKKLLDQFKECSDLDFFDETVSNKEVKDSFVNYIYWKDNIYLKRRELKNIKNL